MPDYEEEYNERAAILEYDAGYDRATAERMAGHMISERIEKGICNE